jgi:hypothetical protein
VISHIGCYAVNQIDSIIVADHRTLSISAGDDYSKFALACIVVDDQHVDVG